MDLSTRPDRATLAEVRRPRRFPRRPRIASALEWAGLALVVGVAAYTRLGHLNLVMFEDDEASVSQSAVALVTGRGIPLIGNPASIGVNNPPMFVYLMAIPYAVTRDPALATGFIGLLGVLAVVGCYLLTRASFGATTGMVAGLLFAANPWAVIYARKIWEPEALPVLAVLFVGSLLAYLSRGRGWQLVATVLWLALAVEVHFSGVVLVLVFVIALVAHRDRFRRQHLVAGAIVALATAAPYLLWQVRHHWADLWAALASAGRPARWDLDAAYYVLSMVGAPGYVFSDGSAPFDLAYRIEGALFVVGLLYAVGVLIVRRRTDPPERRRALGILVVWVLAPIVLFTRHSMDVYRHYVVVVFPAQFIVLGFLVAEVLRMASDRVLASRPAPSRPALAAPRAILGFALALGFAVPQLYAYTAYHDLQWRAPAARRMTIADPYEGGTPVGYLRDVARELASLDALHPGEPIYLQAPAFEKLTALRFLAGRALDAKPLGARTSLLVFPPPGTSDALLATTNVDGPATKLLGTVDPRAHVLTLDYPASDLRVGFYRLGPDTRAAALDALDLTPLPEALDNGVRFLGYRLPRLARRGGAVTLVVAWEVGRHADVSPSGYQFFAHLVDATSRPWGGLDALDYGAHVWSPGDTVLGWYEFKVDPTAPPGLYHVLIGMYDRRDTRLVPVAGNGGPPVDVVSLGPLKVTAGPAVPTGRDAIVQHRQVARLGDQVTLLGYDLSETAARPGDTLSLTLHWVASAARPDYTVFVHLVDRSGRLVAQVDSPPRQGTYPTSAWDVGEYVRDDYRLALPADLPAGTYRLMTGMYRLETGRRLPVTTEDGRPMGDSIELDSRVVVSGG